MGRARQGQGEVGWVGWAWCRPRSTHWQGAWDGLGGSPARDALTVTDCGLAAADHWQRLAEAGRFALADVTSLRCGRACRRAQFRRRREERRAGRR